MITTKVQLLENLVNIESSWKSGEITDAHRTMWDMLGIRQAGTFPEYKDLDRAIGRLLRSLEIRDDGKSLASAMWVAGKVLDEGEKSAYPMGLINLSTAVSLVGK